MTMLVLLGLAAYYVTYVVTNSDFPPVEQLRLKVHTRWRDGSWQWYLVMCSWCVSAYSSAAVVSAAAIWGSVPLPVLTWLAVATLSGTIALLNGLAENRSLQQLKELARPQTNEAAGPSRRRRGRS